MREENKGSFLKHFFVIGGGTAINMLIGLVYTPIITRLVDPTEYGQLSIFNMYAGIAEMVLCLGLDQALVRYYYETNEPDKKRALFLKCILIPVILTLFCSAVFILLVSSGILKFEFNTYISVWLCLCVLVQIINRFKFLLLRLEYKSKQYSLIRILHKLLYLVLVVILAVTIRKEYLSLLVISTVAALAVCTMIGIRAQSEAWAFKRKDISSCPVQTQELIKYALPFIISMGVTQLFQAIDKIALNTYRSYAEVGVYSSAMTLVLIFNIIQVTFNALWGPMQVEHYTNHPEDHSLYQKANQIITVIMFFIGLSLILVKDLFAFILGSKYREAAFILPFLVFNPIMYTISETTVGGLVFKKKSNMQVVVAAGACITNFIGNTLLVPSMGCQGAAISTGLSYIVFFSLRTIMSNKYYYTDFKLKKFYILTGATCLYAWYATFHRFDIVLLLGYLACITLLILLYNTTIQWGISYLKTNGRKFVDKILKREKKAE